MMHTRRGMTLLEVLVAVATTRHQHRPVRLIADLQDTGEQGRIAAHRGARLARHRRVGVIDDDESAGIGLQKPVVGDGVR